MRLQYSREHVSAHLNIFLRTRCTSLFYFSIFPGGEQKLYLEVTYQVFVHRDSYSVIRLSLPSRLSVASHFGMNQTDVTFIPAIAFSVWLIEFVSVWTYCVISKDAFPNGLTRKYMYILLEWTFETSRNIFVSKERNKCSSFRLSTYFTIGFNYGQGGMLLR